MKKKYLMALFMLLLTQIFWAQSTTETFEDETNSTTSFTNNGQVFNITSQAQGPFTINGSYPSTGWNGTAPDNKYIDNDGHAVNGVPVAFTISTANAATFKLNSMWMYLGTGINLNVTGTLTIIGLLGGIPQFTAISSPLFNNQNPAVNNGFTLINMTTFGGANNTTIAIDQVQIVTTANFTYVALDAFNWTKIIPPPTVTTTAATVVGAVKATLGGNVTSDGGATVTERGIVWATTSNPTTSNNKVIIGSGTGSFSSIVSSLPANTLINFRAYAVNSSGTSYGTNLTFTTNAALSAPVATKTDVLCFSGLTGVATVAPTGGAGGYTYSWAPSGGNAATASNLAAGSYTCTITDAEATSITRGVTIIQPLTALSASTGGGQTNVSCNGGSNGTATVAPIGGTGTYTYSWAPSGGTGATAAGLTSGTYTVTVKDANLCSTTRTFNITQPLAPLSALTGGGQTNVSCNGGSNGTATVAPTGGTGTYTYSWTSSSSTTATAAGLAAGSYTVTVTDANTCSTSRTFNITAPPVITTSIAGQTNVSCNGGSNGSATVSATGGTGPGTYTYSWSPSGGSAATASGLTEGTYTVTVTDANTCSTTQEFIITQPNAIVASIAGQTNVSCNGGSNGSATVSATGGTGPGTYTYSWSPSGGSAATASGLTEGTYTITVTDANTCSTTQEFIITQPNAIVASIAGQTNVSCNGGSNGSATVSATGGTGPGTYTYSWSPSGGSAATASGLTEGTYTVTVTDANTCSTTQEFIITQPNAIVASIAGQTNVSCNGGSNGSATVSATGGTGSGTYTYSWSPSGGTAATASGLTEGTYTVTVTDANICSTTQEFIITQPNAIVASIAGQTNVSCNGGSNGSATVSATGGTGPGTYTYSWSPSGGTAATASGLTEGTYTVTVTDANTCSTTQEFIITEPIASILSITRSNNTLTADQAGATYQWFTCPGTDIVGEVGQSFTPTANGSYGVAITLNSCTVLAPCVNVTNLATKDFEEKSKFMIYPNPSQGIINIKSELDADLNIINQSGQIVKTVKVTADNINTIHIENLSDGIYFIRDTKGNKPFTHKLVLKK